jgi:integrase
MTTTNENSWPIDLHLVRARPEGKKGTYVAHFRKNGQHLTKSLGTRRREAALQKARALESQLESDTFVVAPAKVRLDEAIKEFMTAKELEGLSPKSAQKYRGELATLLAFATEKNVFHVQQLDESLLLAYRQHRGALNLARKSAPLHPKTTHTAMMIIVAFLRWSVRRKWLPVSPLQDVRLAKPAFQPKYAPPATAINTLLEAAPARLRAVFYMLAFTGMRSGELQLLRVGDVDLAGNWLLVQSLKAKMTRVRPIRKVPIHPRLRPVLEAHLEGVKADPARPLFCAAPSAKYPAGDHSINTKHLNDDAKRVAVVAGLRVGRRDDGFVIHSFRHGFETAAINSGIPQRVVDAWLGHTGDRSMGSVYYRLSDTEFQAFMVKIAL